MKVFVKLASQTALLSVFILYSCKEKSVPVADSAKESNVPVVESKPISVVEQAYNVPMSQGSGGGDEFVCLLPNGKFVRGYIDYNGGNWIYYQNNESEYKGSYKIINDNLIDVTEIFSGSNGGKYNWKYQFKIVETFGGKAFELRAVNQNGELTNDKSLWFTSADIDVATRLQFK